MFYICYPGYWTCLACLCFRGLLVRLAHLVFKVYLEREFRDIRYIMLIITSLLYTVQRYSSLVIYMVDIFRGILDFKGSQAPEGSQEMAILEKRYKRPSFSSDSLRSHSCCMTLQLFTTLA